MQNIESKTHELRQDKRNRELCKKIKHNDLDAETKLLLENEGLVRNLTSSLEMTKAMEDARYGGIELDDIIEPLLDYTRIMNLEKISEATKSKIKSFIDRIISIGESKNLCFSMEKLDHSKIQSGLVYLYHNDKKMIDLIRSGYFS